MRKLFHTVIIWLMLLAIPLQGFAAAAMPLCASVQPSSVSAPSDLSATTADNHASMHVDMHNHAHEMGGSSEHHSNLSHHSDAKCGVCAACCVGAVMAPSIGVSLVVENTETDRFSSAFSFPRSIVLASLERPPQSLFV
jgi:hypothetical protein